MSYYINLGGIILYGITQVSDDSSREITTYDGIGQGNFPVPDSEKLRTWSIDCRLTEKDVDDLPNWSSASRIFTAFEVLLKAKDPSRFIFVSDDRNESMSAFLTGYSKKESYSGVYDVSVKVTKYKAAGVKTTSIPYVKRPGKAPVIPKKVTFNGKKNTPFTQTQNQAKGSKVVDTTSSTQRALAADFHRLDNQQRHESTTAADFHILESKTGKTVTNAALIKKKETYINSFKSDWKPKEQGAKNIQNIFNSIGNAFTKWKNEEIARRNTSEGY